MENKYITISDLSKSFKNIQALDNISFKISVGKIIGIIGPDGAGKTTLIRLMVGLLKPSQGSVNILGFDTVIDAKNIYPLISYMPQKFGLYEDLTVMQNLNLYAELYNLDINEKENIFKSLLDFTNLHSFTDRLAKKLSGGMKQKLGLACTLLRKPKILFLDEPSVGVDPISRRELWEMVKKLTDDNITIFWSTSYLDEAELCENIVALNQGKLLYFGSPKELTEKLKKRTFQIQNISKDKRVLLRNLIQDQDVIDGVIQGNAIRVVLKKDVFELNISKFNLDQDAKLVEVPPRFEDAFMDLIGPVPKKPSFYLKKIFNFAENSHAVIEIKNLVKKFGNFTAVNDISLSIKRGEIFGLLGPNGAGKSTTFKMLCNLIKPTSGEAFITGISIKNVKSNVRAKIGYMAQKFSLYENMSVIQNLNFFAGIYSINKIGKKDEIQQMINEFHLDKFKNIRSKDLSLGYKQRLALSCATMHSPEVLFLDEPTSGVDPLTRREFWGHINAMVEKGLTIIITTHFMEEAEYCDNIALINRGKIIKQGTPDELKKSVVSEEVQNPTLEDAFIILSSHQNGEKT